jgi:hypothetical protein
MEPKGTLYWDTTARDCKRFVSRIEAVVNAGGDFFE